MKDENLVNIEIYDYLKGFLSENKLTKIESLVSNRSTFIAPVIEDIYQYRNAAAIVRSMEAFSFQKLYAFEKRNSFIPELTVARGADKWIDIEYFPSEEASLDSIKEKGYQLIAVSPEENAIDIQEFKLTKPTALILGTELEGISKKAIEKSDYCIKIPMFGFTQSLNVSVAAAICFYELRNKLEKSDLKWKLSEKEQLKLKIKWAVNSISSGEEILNHYLKRCNHE